MNSPWNTYLRLDSPLLNTIDLRNLWSYVFCKGVQMAIVADNVDNAGFNAIAKSSLLESVYSINQEEIVLHWTSRLQCCNFLHIGLFCLIFVFNWLYLNARIVCNDCIAVYSCLMLFLWSVLKCYQYSLWRYIKFVNLNLNLKKTWRQIHHLICHVYAGLLMTAILVRVSSFVWSLSSWHFRYT